MTFPVVYDPASTPARNCQPGAKALMAWCLANTTASNLGCFVVRNIGTGTRLSLHAEGRALDLGFPATHGGTPEGWALANLLRQHHADLGVQYLIYARKKWAATRNSEGWRHYSGESAHNEHIHAELNRQAAAQLTPDMIATTLGAPAMQAYQTEAVRRIQQALVDAGYDIGSTGVDGDPGPATAAAVEKIRDDYASCVQVNHEFDGMIDALKEQNADLRAQLTAADVDRTAGEHLRQAMIALGRS